MTKRARNLVITAFVDCGDPGVVWQPVHCVVLCTLHAGKDCSGPVTLRRIEQSLLFYPGPSLIWKRLPGHNR
ncbi:hypothetical protein PFLUV_G00049390 [Perca fluviatilis]|uniref:Uncharacterized protein n=1 Tax=Perca fluviatilis TaxID=8168 RepID=A0A6A5FMM7_PERFL|nr:hypothetical protein PFLUV_G00049390 [Perca fluviatilis]